MPEEGTTNEGASKPFKPNVEVNTESSKGVIDTANQITDFLGQRFGVDLSPNKAPKVDTRSVRDISGPMKYPPGPETPRWDNSSSTTSRFQGALGEERKARERNKNEIKGEKDQATRSLPGSDGKITVYNALEKKRKDSVHVVWIKKTKNDRVVWSAEVTERNPGIDTTSVFINRDTEIRLRTQKGEMVIVAVGGKEPTISMSKGGKRINNKPNFIEKSRGVKTPDQKVSRFANKLLAGITL